MHQNKQENASLKEKVAFGDGGGHDQDAPAAATKQSRAELCVAIEGSS